MGSSGTPCYRRYLADPLQLFIMVGNLRGIPYTIRLSGGSHLAHHLIAHGDFMRFGLRVEGGCPNRPEIREDEIRLDSVSLKNWELLRAAALASSAFPVVFRSRPLERPLTSCGYRVAVVPEQEGPPKILQLVPQWEALCIDEPNPSTVNFAAIDGGMFNNQPLDIVRTELAGLGRRNERGGIAADRAVILIDPFSDPVPLGPRQPPQLLGLLCPVLNSLIYQARFKPEDIALAEQPDVYSRFLIAPSGPGPGGSPIFGAGAIASSGLSGFLGFIDRSFQRYDYQLGRRNAYEFLRRDFVFPEGNQAFRWTAPQIEAQRGAGSAEQIQLKPGHLPMIPLTEVLREHPPTPMMKDKWPCLEDIPSGLSAAIEARLQVIYDRLMAEYRPASRCKREAVSFGLRIPWRLFLRSALRDKVLDQIRTALKARQLLRS